MSKHWSPSKKIIESSNIKKMMQSLSIESYDEFWRWSAVNKSEFWEQTVVNLGIRFKKNYTKIVDISQGVYNARWLAGASLNIVDSCFQNTDESTAIVFRKEDGTLEKVSQEELEDLANSIANGFVDKGLQSKDVIAVYMPMTVEAVAVYLAAIKAGFVVATIADSFSEDEINTRLQLTNPKLIVTQDAFLRAGKTHALYSKCKQVTDTPIVVVKTQDEEENLRTSDTWFEEFVSDDIYFDSVACGPQDAITILFSSGTTGTPKAIPWDHTTPIKSASDAYYHHNIKEGDILCWPTNLGWMMGPWLVFAALINKATIALYDGSPLESGFGAFVEKAKVTMLGVVPSIVKSWKQSGVMESFDWRHLQCYSSTGEVSDPKEMQYLMHLEYHRPVIEYCGGTEIGGGYISSTMVQENIPGQFSTQALGGNFVLLDDDGNLCDTGEVFLLPPIMGLSTRLLHKDHYSTYYAGIPPVEGNVLRRHGDEMQALRNGYYRANGRVDDTMNLGGIKIGSVQLEAVVNALDFVEESAAIGVAPKGGGPSNLIVYIVPSNNIAIEEALEKVQEAVKKKLNPLFKVVDLVKIDSLPRTASNKIKRKQLRVEYQQNDGKRTF